MASPTYPGNMKVLRHWQSVMSHTLHGTTVVTVQPRTHDKGQRDLWTHTPENWGSSRKVGKWAKTRKTAATNYGKNKTKQKKLDLPDIIAKALTIHGQHCFNS